MLLTALIAVALAAFTLTRAAAASNERMREADAAAWYQRGRAALARGEPTTAVTALRRAASKAPGNRDYSLALADALAADRHDGAAEQVLQRLRDAQPELPEANLALARLEARRGDVTAAIRDYQHTLTGLWTTDRETERQEVRLELIRFLLDHHQQARALSELLIMSVRLPDTPEAHLAAGDLFLEAGDAARALEHFEAVLSHNRDHAAALAGAGRAAFQLGDYSRAARFLRVESTDPQVAQLRDLTARVLGGDPLAARLPRSERVRRLLAVLDQARGALGSCVTRLAPDASARTALQAADAEAASLRAQLATTRRLPDTDIVEDGTDLAYRIERQVESACGLSAPADRAILLIGKRHGLDPQ